MYVYVHFLFYFIDPTTITDPNSDVSLEATLEGMVVISCTARGLPTPNITWSPDPKLLPSSSTDIDNQGYLVTTSNLTIVSIQRDDTMYSCITTNTGRSDTRVFNITVTCKFSCYCKNTSCTLPNSCDIQ